MTIQDRILLEATKLIARHQRYAMDLEDRLRRIERRTLVKPNKIILTPKYWSADAGFNPYHVRSHAASISYAIQRGIAAGTYQPKPAISFEVSKEGGGTRTVSVFQVADNAVSRLVYKQLLAKNSSRLSAHCYAYRTDLTLHDAVLDVAADLRDRKRLFVAEFDFSKYFDSISHEHIETILKTRRFFVTETELRVIRAFLRAPTLDEDAYTSSSKDSKPEAFHRERQFRCFSRILPLNRSINALNAWASGSPVLLTTH